MVIYFSASHRQIEKDIANYRAIVQAIHELGHVIANNWLEVARYAGRGDRSVEEWRQICENARHGIADADLVVAEATGVSGFGAGFEVGLAMEAKKPILALVEDGHERESYISVVSHPLLTVKTYSAASVDSIIKEYVAVKEQV